MMKQAKKPFYGLVALASSLIITTTLLVIGILLSLYYSLLWGMLIVLAGLYSLSAYVIPLYYINPFKSIDFSRTLTLHGNERILDVGCGLGRATNGLAKFLTTGKVIGVDIWDNLEIPGNSPEKAYRNAEIEGVRNRVEFRYGDAFYLPFEDESFDVVNCSGLLTSFRSDEGKIKAIGEMRRVLKKKGILLVREPVNKIKTLLVLTPQIYVINMPSKGHWIELLEQAQFTNIEYFPHRIAGSFKTIKT